MCAGCRGHKNSVCRLQGAQEQCVQAQDAGAAAVNPCVERLQEHRGLQAER